MTHDIELKMKRLGTDDWVTQARRRKWCMAKRMLIDSDNRWSSVALKWDPTIMSDGNAPAARRRVARPKTRWTDEFVKVASRYCQESVTWLNLMNDEVFWNDYEDALIYNLV